MEIVPLGEVIKSFGLAAVKAERTRAKFDAQQRGERVGGGADYMELRIPKNASRKRVHAAVDRWLDSRKRGFR